MDAMSNAARILLLAIVVSLTSRVTRHAQLRTWRLEFYSTGGPGIEAYSFDRVVIEPVAWPDNRSFDVDTRLTGNYRFEVVDATGRVIFARGYDPAFAEWATTAEVKQLRRT